MTSSLRSRVVEAGVDAIINDRGIGDVIVGSDEWVMVWEDVVVALDAALDCLTENLDDRDRWADVLQELREDR